VTSSWFFLSTLNFVRYLHIPESREPLLLTVERVRESSNEKC